MLERFHRNKSIKKLEIHNIDRGAYVTKATF